jgi:hypothetical protein
MMENLHLSEKQVTIFAQDFYRHLVLLDTMKTTKTQTDLTYFDD